jgi:hypothetical protein
LELILTMGNAAPDNHKELQAGVDH